MFWLQKEVIPWLSSSDSSLKRSKKGGRRSYRLGNDLKAKVKSKVFFTFLQGAISNLITESTAMPRSLEMYSRNQMERDGASYPTTVQTSCVESSIPLDLLFFLLSLFDPSLTKLFPPNSTHGSIYVY